MSDMDRWFREMLEKGLVSTTAVWIDQATVQKHPKMTPDLASSTPLVYDELDKTFVNRERLN